MAGRNIIINPKKTIFFISLPPFLDYPWKRKGSREGISLELLIGSLCFKLFDPVRNIPGEGNGHI